MDRAVLLKRSFSTVVLWVTVLGMIFSGWKTGCVVLLGVAALLAQWEFYRIQEEKKFRVFKKWGVTCGAILYVGCWFLLLHASAYAGRFALWEHLVFVALTIGVLLRLVVFPDPLETPIVSVALTLFGFFYVPYLFSFVAQVAFLPGAPYEATFTILYLLAVTKFCDAGAYVVGSLWGRHKMIPRISPGKTWEGFAGGILTSMAVSIFLWRLHPQGLPPSDGGTPWFAASFWPWPASSAIWPSRS